MLKLFLGVFTPNAVGLLVRRCEVVFDFARDSGKAIRDHQKPKESKRAHGSKRLQPFKNAFGSTWFDMV